MKLLCFLGGMLAGGALMYLVIDKTLLSPLLYDGALANAGAHLHALIDLRDGKTNEAVSLLEIKLDGDLIPLVNYDKGQPRINPSQFKMISRIAAYRQQYPRKTEFPAVDATVQKVLTMPPPQSNSP